MARVLKIVTYALVVCLRLAFGYVNNYRDSTEDLASSKAIVELLNSYITDSEQLTWSGDVTSDKEVCLELLANFSAVASTFSSCLLENSLPPRFCKPCSAKYIQFEKTFFALMDKLISEESSTKFPCGILDKQTRYLQYARKLHEHLTNKFWLESNCPGCLVFEISNISSKYATIKGYNAESAAVMNASKKFELCINRSSFSNGRQQHYGDICSNCSSEYKSVVACFKKSLDGKARYCSDIFSVMYSAINFWRHEANCSSVNPTKPRGVPRTIVVLLVSVFVLPSTFYFLSWLLVSNKTRILRKYKRLRHKSGHQQRVLSRSSSAGQRRGQADGNAPVDQDLPVEADNLQRTANSSGDEDSLSDRDTGRKTSRTKKRKRTFSYSQLPTSQLG